MRKKKKKTSVLQLDTVRSTSVRHSRGGMLLKTIYFIILSVLQTTWIAPSISRGARRTAAFSENNTGRKPATKRVIRLEEKRKKKRRRFTLHDQGTRYGQFPRGFARATLRVTNVQYLPGSWRHFAHRFETSPDVDGAVLQLAITKYDIFFNAPGKTVLRGAMEIGKTIFIFFFEEEECSACDVAFVQ